MSLCCLNHSSDSSVGTQRIEGQRQWKGLKKSLTLSSCPGNFTGNFTGIFTGILGIFTGIFTGILMGILMGIFTGIFILAG